MSTYTPPIDLHAENRHHWPLNESSAANRRKALAIIALFLTLIGTVWAIIYLVTRPAQVVVVGLTPKGPMILSNSAKKLDIREFIINGFIRQDLLAISQMYFSRERATARRDYQDFEWFLHPRLWPSYEDAAGGTKGWLTQLEAGTIPEVHAEIHQLELSPADIETPPYKATVFVTRTIQGKVFREIAKISFIIDTHLPAKNQEWIAHNALGLLIVKPIEEFPDLITQ